MKCFSSLFWCSSILFVAHQIIENWISIPYVHAYLDDLLAPPIVLGLALFFFQKIFPADPTYQHSKLLLVLFVFWYSILFEGIFPVLDARHYADYWDVLAYSLGTIVFNFWGNKPLVEQKRPNDDVEARRRFDRKVKGIRFPFFNWN